MGRSVAVVTNDAPGNADRQTTKKGTGKTATQVAQGALFNYCFLSAFRNF